MPVLAVGSAIPAAAVVIPVAEEGRGTRSAHALASGSAEADQARCSNRRGTSRFQGSPSTVVLSAVIASVWLAQNLLIEG